MPEGSSIGPRKLAQSDLDIPSAGLTDVSYWPFSDMLGLVDDFRF
jgi:hypothetical protein